MRRPDFARTDLEALGSGDLRFLLENLPRPAEDYAAIAETLERLPDTIESMLTSDYVYRLIRDRERLLLGISPFLLFSVLLRRTLGRPRGPVERRVLNYLANLLSLFIHSDRLHRIEPTDGEPHRYIVTLLAEAAEADPRRAFATQAHIGNYVLWLTGLQRPWLEQRYRYGRRPVSPDYYEEWGQAAFGEAARHELARRFGLDDVFLRLAMMFAHYREGLEAMRRRLMAAG